MNMGIKSYFNVNAERKFWKWATRRQFAYGGAAATGFAIVMMSSGNIYIAVLVLILLLTVAFFPKIEKTGMLYIDQLMLAIGQSFLDPDENNEEEGARINELKPGVFLDEKGNSMFGIFLLTPKSNFYELSVDQKEDALNELKYTIKSIQSLKQIFFQRDVVIEKDLAKMSENNKRFLIPANEREYLRNQLNKDIFEMVSEKNIKQVFKLLIIEEGLGKDGKNNETLMRTVQEGILTKFKSLRGRYFDIGPAKQEDVEEYINFINK